MKLFMILFFASMLCWFLLLGWAVSVAIFLRDEK